MSPEQWSQAKALFGTLIDRDPSQWPELLSGASDPEIAAEVRRLLAAHATGAEFLGRSPAETLSADDRLLGQSLGPFLIESLLGEGGGGRVYLARRADVGGQVALKILRARFASAEARRRFQAEQSILARLDHPNIARLMQVGITDDGTPWLAMEYVEGQPFAEVMAALPIRDRVRLIIKLLGAVDYAHRQLVVHRDIKPGNILVDSRNEPRLLDFGIAKRLDDVTSTQVEFQPRTPAYASPEQVSGEPISVASDVYTMGVLLYEVLSGHHPWLNSGKNLDDAILSCEAALPSSWVQGPERRQLQGDLDAIVLQAMRRQPQARYPSAAAMAEDLQRYLEFRPVQAQKQTWLYRSRRFLMRNHRILAAAALLVVLLGVALVREHRLQSEAALEAQKASQVAEFMLDVFAAGDALGTGFNINKESTVLDLMARGVTRLESLQSAPLVRADLAQKMGQVYWGYSEFGAAEKLFTLALKLREAALGASDQTAESYLMLGRVYERTGRYDEMIAAMQTSHDMRLKALGPDDPRTIHSLHRVGAAYYQLQDLERANVIALQAIEAWREHLPEHSLEMANSYTIHALSEFRMGGFEEALRAIDEALSLRRAVLPDDHNLIAEGLTNRARCLYALGRIDEAIASLRQSLAINQRIFTNDHWDLVLQYEKLAQYLVARGDLAEAEQIADQALAMAGRLHQRTPNPELVDLARQAKIMVLRAQGQLPPALELARDVLQSRLQHLPPLHSNTLTTRSVLADLLRRNGDYEQARAELALALEGWRQRPKFYVPELDKTMNGFAQDGHCAWLGTTWPAAMPPRMAAAIARDRGTCGI
ncbi:MAG: tetratricopeptide repeat protein [Lysobacterales bacterium]